jgi:ketosteroid isomerase-like protein
MSEKSITKQFYKAFEQLDAMVMTACYHDEIVFEDPAFGRLEGDRARAMWTMLCQNAKDLEVQYEILEEDDRKASVKWEAVYTFDKTGRKVHNIVVADLTLEDGKIIQHTDRFKLWKWAGQAMGLSGHILGGTTFFKKRLQQQTNRLLDKFITANEKV